MGSLAVFLYKRAVKPRFLSFNLWTKAMLASFMNCNNLRCAVQIWYPQITVLFEVICVALLSMRLGKTKIKAPVEPKYI